VGKEKKGGTGREGARGRKEKGRAGREKGRGRKAAGGDTRHINHSLFPAPLNTASHPVTTGHQSHGRQTAVWIDDA